MNQRGGSSRILGIAFLFQFVTSVASGLLVQPALIVPGDIVGTMARIAEHPGLMRLNILLDTATALGVVFLGAMLYLSVRKAGEGVALVALGFYILEGALLGASKLQSFSLLRMSQAYVIEGRPAYLETLAALAFESADFVGFTLHVLAFCVGGMLFYALLYRARAVPRGLSLWGLITLVPLLVATLLAIFEIEAPGIIVLPYFPFEFVIGVWILVRGTDAAGAFQGAASTGRVSLAG